MADDQLLLDVLPDVTGEVEDEDDLAEKELKQLNQTVVAASDWTTETIIRQLDRGTIDINPEFQRRDAWTPSRKSKFVESLILGLPIPQLVLAENKRQKGSFIVIDGKQRLLSLRQFAATAEDKIYSSLKLSGLEVRSDLNGKTLRDLEATPANAEDLTAFQNQTIRTVVIKNWPNESVLYLIFLRLNTSSVPLAPQELRQALHPGPFLKFVDKRSGESKGFKKLLKLTRPDFRMRDAELLVRYFAFKNFITTYRGNLKEFLDNTCETLNSDWEAVQTQVATQVDELENGIQTTFEIFGEEDAFRKWDGAAYERRFNRAVFDIMLFYLSQPAIRKKAIPERIQIVREFRRLCEQSSEFRKSLETTTKSLEATALRLNIWGQALARRTRMKFSIPKLENKKIIM
ncbi:MAG TPA: DUF262 domain-containing protein [Terriglobales bacterium]|nr:DUF262 domain-containing protein [Terriglobales bacterium]